MVKVLNLKIKLRAAKEMIFQLDLDIKNSTKNLYNQIYSFILTFENYFDDHLW